MRRALAPLAVLALLLAGCTAGSGGADSGASEVSVVQDEGAGGGGAVGSAADAPAAGVVADVDDAGRQVVTEGSVTLTVDSPRRAAQDAATLVEQAGGHVQERVEQAGQGADDDTAHLVVRVPAEA